MVVRTGLVEALAPFGFAEYDARAYAALLERQPATAYEVAKGAGIPDSKVYRVLEKLEARGVVTLVGREPATFAALPPDALLGRLESAARRQLADARRALERVAPRESPVAAWPLAGGQAVLDRAAALVAAARVRVEVAAGGAALGALASAIAAARSRRVAIAVSRAADRHGMLALLADDTEALVARLTPAADGGLDGRGLASREPALVELLRELLIRRREAAERDEAAPAADETEGCSAFASLEAALAPGRLDIC
jgi:sugar-specific transcriptional regulator TrmB